MPVQEKGIKPACSLPYELYADGTLDATNKIFSIKLQAGNTLFGAKSAGCPFKIYAPGRYKGEDVKVWNYAVAAGDALTDTWPLGDFEGSHYHLCVYGPNGFFRTFKGSIGDRQIDVKCTYQLDKTGHATGNILLHLKNLDKINSYTVILTDNAYKAEKQTKTLGAAGSAGAIATVVLDLQASYHWYDFTVSTADHDSFSKRFAGHVETGEQSYSDPKMGGLV